MQAVVEKMRTGETVPSVPVPPIRNLSVSRIEQFLKCPLSFKYRVIDKIPEPSGGVLHAGRVVHDIIENALKEYGRTGRYPSWQTMDDQYLPTWERKTKQEEEKPTFIGWTWDADDPMEKVREECRPLVRLAREQALEHLRPWMLETGPVVEHRVDMEFRSEVGPFKTIGYIDLLDDTGMLSDWKTTKKVSERAKKGWMQSASYSFWVWPMVGEEVVRAQKIFLVRGENPHVEFAPCEVGPAHRAWFAKIGADVWKSVVYGVYPARNEGWHCSPKFCSFHGPCQEGIWKPEEENTKKACGACKGTGKEAEEQGANNVANGTTDAGTAA